MTNNTEEWLVDPGLHLLSAECDGCQLNDAYHSNLICGDIIQLRPLKTKPMMQKQPPPNYDWNGLSLILNNLTDLFKTEDMAE